MPTRCRGMTESDRETTLLKYVHTRMSRRSRDSPSFSRNDASSNSLVSSSNFSPNDASSDSMYSNNRSHLTERTSSTVPPEYPPRRDFRHRHNHTSQVPLPSRSLRAHGSSSHSRSESTRTSSRPSPFLQRRCLVIMTIISVTASIVTCCVVALCVVYKLVPILDDNTFQEGDYEGCVQSSRLGHAHSHTAALRDFTIKLFPDGLKYYCARNTGQMSSLFQIIMSQRKSTEVVPQARKPTFPSTSVSAHRYLLQGSSAHSQGDSQCEKEPCHLQLDSTTNNSRQHNQLFLVHRDHMEIIYSGWYFVYSSIYIWSKADFPCGHLFNQTFRHFVSRSRSTSSNDSGCLVESSHTCCDDCSDDYHTSYVAGVFELKTGDRISVNVRGSSRVLFEGNGTYLGLVMLSSSSGSSTES